MTPKKRGRHPTDPQAAARVVKLYQAGQTVQQISETLGLSDSTIRRIIKQSGLGLGVLGRLLLQTSGTTRTLEDLAAEVAQRLAAGTPMTTIAAEMQVNAYTLRKLLEATGHK
jgi:DNA invertase Pin-like site-specific DNA recombinase